VHGVVDRLPVGGKVETLRGDSVVQNVLATRLRYNVISINTLGNNLLLFGVEQTILVESSPTKALQRLSTSRSNSA
jgi:hypothetical protein